MTDAFLKKCYLKIAMGSAVAAPLLLVDCQSQHAKAHPVRMQAHAQFMHAGAERLLLTPRSPIPLYIPWSYMCYDARLLQHA